MDFRLIISDKFLLSILLLFVAYCNNISNFAIKTIGFSIICSDFTKYRMNKGLYNSDYEHDACGVGMIVNIHGNKSHDLVDNALKVLENMRHRGAEGADNKTGDGAGIMLQIPHEFILLQGIPVPEKGK